jgi:hypothetical protein
MSLTFRTLPAAVALAVVCATRHGAGAIGPAAPGTVTVTDDTGTFSVTVPAGWSDALTDAVPSEAGELIPNLTVGPDLAAYHDGTGDGLLLLVFPGALDDGPMNPRGSTRW